MEPPTSPFDYEGDARKRVCKACDRCRIKKSKCDGKKPCSRCRNDDAICVFGGRKRKSERVHPKGYVEILERQQKQLVKGIRALYDRQVEGRAWDGPKVRNGYPPTHEILEHLGALEVVDTSDDEEQDDGNRFEESIRRLRQSVAIDEGNHPSNVRNGVGPILTSQAGLIPNQRPRDYFGKTQMEYANEPVGSPRSSPDSLTTSKTSPSTSIDSQHWTTSIWLEHNQSTWPDKGVLTAADFTNYSDHDPEDSPMPDRFEDPFLVPPWAPEEDLNGIMYQE